MSPLYDATDPDLRPFRDRGGKLILWHGWEDAYVAPQGTLAYYQAMQDVTGGLAATQQFARLYLLPGYAHCTGGTGPSGFDIVHPLLDWVEQGVAPEGIVTTQERDGKVVRTRPVYPYPAVARYDGSGSIDDADNFVAAPPPTPPDDHIDWAGEFRSGYQEWCAWEGTRLVCRRDRHDRPCAPLPIVPAIAEKRRPARASPRWHTACRTGSVDGAWDNCGEGRRGGDRHDA
jgi:feruloyl esterase